MSLQANSFTLFLSTPSARRATEDLVEAGRISQISIHALREEGDRNVCPPGSRSWEISIHALREEGDEDLIEPEAVERKISIHALREEGDRGISSAPI